MTDALICIGSPLQAICAVEAIAEYKIDQYEFFVIDDGVRLSQIKKFLDERTIVYTVVPYHIPLWKNILRVINVVNPFIGQYDLLLMGDYRLSSNRMEYVPLVKNGGKIVYLDDGTYIVGWAKGLLVETRITRIRNRIMDIVCGLRGISYKNLFTMFANDITMHGYSVRNNTLSQLQMFSKTIGDDIFFIGTTPLGASGYCTHMGIDYDYYLKVLDRLLFDIRRCNPKRHIIYVPHGRDTSKETLNICKRLRIEYERLPECVELYALSAKNNPKEIWGFGSTALYTLCKLCKGTKITNVIIQGTNSNSLEEYRWLSIIYSQNNINNIWV